ncbi:hypothetical protein GCM10009792_05950 [Microcella alkalica]|uniref:Uncharacterized protein YcnI n=1 Tax=Microcella alkalica TaxID=355930 RepID=A0A839E5B0_9MICO|nr:DUF1775 domain-containing protein [Microcella alkalica]MBA8846717.1 uncharacterized protein YcnI [Microcella alkalica]
MTARTRTTAAAALAAGLLLPLVIAAPAHADATAKPDSSAAGSRATVTFTIPHGCEASPTEIVTITIPQSIPTVTPSANANWTVERVLEAGDSGAERVAQVVYTAKDEPLPSEVRDSFDLTMTLPETEGETLEFPVRQDCTVGDVTWDGDLVPAFTTTEAIEGGDGHGGGHGAAGASDESDEHGDEEGSEHGEEPSDEAGSTELTSGSAAIVGGDVIARILGALGLVAGAVALALALIRRRGASS